MTDIVPVPGINRAVVQAINVARSISDDVRAVYISDDPDAATAYPVSNAVSPTAGYSWSFSTDSSSASPPASVRWCSP